MEIAAPEGRIADMRQGGTEILIAYATGDSEGQTARIVRRLAGVLREGGASVDVVDCEALPGDLRVDAYDAVLVGGSVRGARFRRSLRRFLRRGSGVLARIPWAFFSVCLMAASTREEERDGAMELPWRFVRKQGLEPRAVAVFPGALRFSRHGRIGGRVLFHVNRRYLGETDMSHDWEYTDWDEVDGFARRFLASLAPAAA